MSTASPPDLGLLLDARSEPAKDQAWERFVHRYSRLLYRAAQSTTDGYDDTMDRFMFVLDQLRDRDFRRLRRYAADGRTQFSTWLVVVARRLSLDYHRARYGRWTASSASDRDARRAARRSLVDLVGSEIDIDSIADPRRPSPEIEVCRAELRDALTRAVGELEPRDQVLLRLRFQDDATAREISSILHFPSPFHVYRRLKTVMKRLRVALERRGFDDVSP